MYIVQGENARVNVNSTDHSVNIVKSSAEFFSALRTFLDFLFWIVPQDSYSAMSV